MTAEIPPEYRQFVENMIGSGAFPTEAAVVGEALRLFQERLDRLRQELQPALDRLDRGEGIDLDEQSIDDFFEDIKARGRQHLEAKQETP
jgi:Arc/MetJ-type ribon-helix-helix transcriptional regulator